MRARKTGGKVNRQSAIALGVAILIGLVAVYLANTYLTGVQQVSEDKQVQAKLTKIAVASQTIELGLPLTNTNVAMVDWPANSVPQGSFNNLEAATRNRMALDKIVPGEPILANRVSGPDGRATLSVRLPANQYAVSVSVNAVSGVAGFVRPGDLVDVLLTRPIPLDNANGAKMTDVVLQSVPVLAIDQVLDKQNTEAAVGATATLQVDMKGAQKLALAREMGSLSLALRNLEPGPEPRPNTVIPRDLGANRYHMARTSTPRSSAPAPAKSAPSVSKQLMPPRYYGPTMTIVRQDKPTVYEVPHGF